jgi:hypothetical protein
LKIIFILASTFDIYQYMRIFIVIIIETMIFKNNTTNECKYYLYQYYRLDKNEPFYVGVGTRYTRPTDFNRAKTVRNHNKVCGYIINKTEYIIEILEESDDYCYMKQREIEFIGQYGKIINGTGTLANITDGGEGLLGYSPNNKNIYVYSKAGEFIKEFASAKLAAEYFKASTSHISRSASMQNQLVKGYQFRFFKADNIPAILDVKEKMRQTKSRAVIQFNLSGSVIKEWESITGASTKLHICSTHIHSCCSGKGITAGGFQWKYKEYKVNEPEPSVNNIPSANTAPISKPIVQIYKDGTVVREWDSINQASQATNIDRGHISQCCQGKRKSTGGFKWFYI